jgi:manganese transport protein
MEKKQIIPHASLSSINLQQIVPFKQIAIAVDFSSKDEQSISHAIHTGGKHAAYVLIHVVESAAARQYNSHVEDKETQLDRESLSFYAKELSDMGYQVKPCLGFGERTKSIIQIVKAENCELLVMGAHGHHTLKDWLFGSTVDAVRHRLKIPVLVV